MRAGPSDVVLVLSDVREVGEIAECADDLDRFVARQPIQRGFQRAAGYLILVPAEADGALADAFDDVEDRIALLAAHGVTENTPEQTDVFAQRDILLGIERLVPYRA